MPKNILFNGGFELGSGNGNSGWINNSIYGWSANWTRWAPEDFMASFDNTVFKTGTQSMRLDIIRNTQGYPVGTLANYREGDVSSHSCPFKSTARYKITASMIVEKLAYVEVKAWTLTYDSKSIGSINGKNWTNSSGQWVESSFITTAQTNSSARNLGLIFTAVGSGMENGYAYIDDVKVEEVGLHIKVNDYDDSSPLINANVYITDGTNVYSGLTDADGWLVLGASIPNGVYQISVQKEGHEDYGGTINVIYVNDTQDIVIYMNPVKSNILVDKLSINFGESELGETKTDTLTISNSGNADLTFSSAFQGGGFTASSYGGTITPGNSQTITITFVPDEEKVYDTFFDISSNDPDDPLTSIPMYGSGKETHIPQISLNKLSINFGEVDLGVPKTDTLTISNVGNNDLTFNLSFQSGGFIANSYSGTILPSESSTITLTFTPVEEKTYSSYLDISSNDPDNPLISMPLTGIGKELHIPGINVNKTSIDFGQAIINSETKTDTLVVSNTGTNTLHANFSLTNSEGFVSDTTGGDIGVGESMIINLAFTPTELKQYDSSLVITSDDINNPIIEIPLSGEGVLHKNEVLNKWTYIAVGGAIVTAVIVALALKMKKNN